MSTIGPSAAGGGLQEVMALRRQIAEQSDALRGLRDAGNLAPVAPQAPITGAQPTGAPVGGGFADTLRNTIEQVSATQDRSSAITQAYERGEVTDIAQVMLARQESGVAFEATLQVRNKLLSAYQEIMRMGV